MLLLALAGGLLLPLSILALLVVSRSHDTMRDEARRHNERVAVHAAARNHLERLAESSAQRPGLADAIHAGDADTVRAHLEELVREDDAIDRAFIADPDGIERYDHPRVAGVIGEDFSHRDWYRGARRSGGTYTSEVYRRAAPPRHHLVAVTAPVPGAGYLVVQRTVHDLASWLGDLPPERRGSQIWLFGRHGGLAMADGPGQTPPDPSQEMVERAVRAVEVGSEDAADPFTSEPSLVSYAPVPVLGGSVLVSRPLSAVMWPARLLERWIYGLSAVAAVAMVGLGFAWTSTVRKQHLALVELTERKDLLTTLVVHDIRNPLTVARTVASAVAAGLRTSREHAAELDEALQRIQNLADNLLGVMKLEEGRMDVVRERTDVSALVARTVKAYEPAAAHAGVELTADAPAPVEATLDPSLTTRIAENLITNALKHTQPGGAVRASLADLGDAVSLEISDTGEGISAADIPQLFRKYGRVEGQRGSRASDTGFGLVFCRMAVERHGGRIEVESEVDRGSTFRVILPKS